MSLASISRAIQSFLAATTITVGEMVKVFYLDA